MQEHLLPLQKQINVKSLRDSSKTLDEIESSLSRIKADRRTRSWTEKAHDTFTYISYLAVIVIVFLIFYKCGILELITKCMPNVCLKICCPTNNVTNNVMPQHSVTYVPSAPNADTNISSIEPLSFIVYRICEKNRLCKWEEP